jgi:hypothetical protein
MLQIDYEETVADVETTARRLIDWCGLDWEPTCLAFHETQRVVRTASNAQVRQPIYKRSVERWKNYEAEMGELFERLEAEIKAGRPRSTPRSPRLTSAPLPRAVAS